MNRKLLLITALFLLTTAYLKSQVVKNGSFEDWSLTAIDYPDGWFTTLNDGRGITEITIKKVTGQNGSAIKLITEATAKDTIFGFFNLSEGDPEAGEGGVPYSQKPDSIIGYYKHDIKTGDSALLLVVFKKNGTVVSTDLFKVGGTKTNFTRFAFKLSLGVTPDSVIIAAASSNAIDNVGVKPGSTITYDELAFVGTGVTQVIPSGNFDNWTTDTLANPFNWATSGRGIKRTPSAQKGNYAIVLETQKYEDGNVSGVAITNGYFPENEGPKGGVPFASMSDTLVFYYKYVPSGTDTAQVGINLFKMGTQVGGQGVDIMPAANYTRIEVPFQAGTLPDTMLITFISSNFPGEPTNEGSKLYLDEIHLKSQPLNTGIFTVVKNNLGVTAYPNPVTDKLTIDLNNTGKINTVLVTDMLGKVIIQENNVSNRLQLDTQSWPQGIYLYTITTETGLVNSGKVIKK